MLKASHNHNKSAKAAKTASKSVTVKTKKKHLPDLSHFRSTIPIKGKPLSQILIEGRR